MPHQSITAETLDSYLQQMESLLSLSLSVERHHAVLLQLQRIADMAQPLMAYPLDNHDEVAGEYRL